MSEPALHIVVIAWRRLALARQTVESFLALNAGAGTGRHVREIQLWFAMDGGRGDRRPDDLIVPVLTNNGFLCLVRHVDNQGIAATFSDAIRAVANRANPDDLILPLEEDWESVRPLPMQAIRELMARPEIGWVWLFGRHKERAADGTPMNRTDDRNRGIRPGMPQIAWTPEEVAGEHVLIGDGYWEHPPMVTTVGRARLLAAGAETGGESAERSVELGLKTAWLAPDNPVFIHTGAKSSYKEIGGKR